MSVKFPASRVLFVHAHPDDETLATGALIASLVAQGVAVGLVTATRGERGEVVPGSWDGAGGAARLSDVRERELESATAALGIGWHAFLGTPPARAKGAGRRYLDSGMRWIKPGLAGPSSDSGPLSLTSAPLSEVAGDLAAAVAAYRADALVSYDAEGGYGHPDHVRCYAAVVEAARATSIPFYQVLSDPSRRTTGDIVIDGHQYLAIVQRALDAHRTQLSVDATDVVHSGGQREPIVTTTVLRRAAD